MNSISQEMVKKEYGVPVNEHLIWLNQRELWKELVSENIDRNVTPNPNLYIVMLLEQPPNFEFGLWNGELCKKSYM